MRTSSDLAATYQNLAVVRRGLLHTVVQGAVSLHCMYDNCARVPKTLGTTPAVAAGIADHERSVAEIVALLASF
jgi:hypothetical protein